MLEIAIALTAVAGLFSTELKIINARRALEVFTVSIGVPLVVYLLLMPVIGWLGITTPADLRVVIYQFVILGASAFISGYVARHIMERVKVG